MRRSVWRFPFLGVLSIASACASTPPAKAGAVTMENPAALPYCEPAPGVGAIQGVVRDQATGLAISDVTVVATSPAISGSRSELTDRSGGYLISDVPAGDYEVVFYYGEIQIRQAHVIVGDGKVTLVTIKIDTAATGGKVVDVAQKAPTIDGDFGPGPVDPNDPHGGRLWAGRGVAIGQDYTKNVPLATRSDVPPAPPKCRPRLPAHR